MIISVKCEVTRRHLIWAVAYLRHHNEGRVFGDQIFKADVLKFLRDQFSMFGTEHCFGSCWEEDLEEHMKYAEDWVFKRFPELWENVA